MARLFSNDPSFEGGEHLVQRRDGMVPEWPYFVMAASDPAASEALFAYAGTAERLGMDPAYVADIRVLGHQFEQWYDEHGAGDPDAPRHRVDGLVIVAEMV